MPEAESYGVAAWQVVCIKLLLSGPASGVADAHFSPDARVLGCLRLPSLPSEIPADLPLYRREWRRRRRAGGPSDTGSIHDWLIAVRKQRDLPVVSVYHH